MDLTRKRSKSRSYYLPMALVALAGCGSSDTSPATNGPGSSRSSAAARASAADAARPTAADVAASRAVNSETEAAALHVQTVGGRMEIRLDFSHSDITDNDLATLPLPTATTSIDLSYTRVTDDGLAHLERFEGLEELHIASTEITDAGIEQLMKLEKLRLIHADQSNISRKGQLKLIKFLAPRAQAHAERAGTGTRP